NAGGEEQSVRWPGVRVVAEGERPKPIDGQDGIVGILHEADEFVREAVERGNLAAAEIAYENGVAELAEIARGPDNSPRRIEPGTMLEVADVPAGGCEELDEAEAVTGNVIVAGGVLLRVSVAERSAAVMMMDARGAARKFLGLW